MSAKYNLVGVFFCGKNCNIGSVAQLKYGD